MAENQQKAKPELSDEAKAKQAARAAAKAKGGKGGAKASAKRDLPDRPRPPARLWVRYRDEVRTQLQKELGLKSTYQVPTIEKIVVNMGLGDAITNNKVLDTAIEEIELITGQKAVVTRAKKSISNFKLREGMPIGAMVTLRKNTMWEFLDRVIAVALPRVRDFKGISDKAFDGRGNYTLGLKEQIIFPEIEYDRVDKIRGMNICIVTTAKDDIQGKALLEALGLPMWKRGQANG
jgi:large subunit ribosomal protein L5